MKEKQQKQHKDRYTDLLSYLQGETADLPDQRLDEYLVILRKMIRKQRHDVTEDDLINIVNDALLEVVVEVKKGKVRDILSFAHFAVLRAIDLYQEELDKRRKEEPIEDYKTGKEIPSPEEAVLKLELDQEIKEAILNLKDEYRTIVIRHYLDEIPLVEIARELGLPEGQMSEKRKRAIAMIRNQLILEVPAAKKTNKVKTS